MLLSLFCITEGGFSIIKYKQSNYDKDLFSQLRWPFPHPADHLLCKDDRHLDDLLYAQPILGSLHTRHPPWLEELKMDEQSLSGCGGDVGEEKVGDGDWNQHGHRRHSFPGNLLGSCLVLLFCHIHYEHGHFRVTILYLSVRLKKQLFMIFVSSFKKTIHEVL